MTKIPKTFLLALAAFASVRHADGAGPTLDQSYIVLGFEADVALFEILGYAQTFTAGRTGVISQVDVQIYKQSGATGAVALTILDTVGGVPNQVLHQTSVPFNNIPTIDNPFLPVALTTTDTTAGGVFVSAGQTLAIDLQFSPGVFPAGVLWRTDIDGQYAGGDQFSRFGFLGGEVAWTPVSTIYDGTPVDGGFQVWIEPVPEPSGFLLAFSGFVCAASFAARRNLAKRMPVS